MSVRVGACTHIESRIELASTLGPQASLTRTARKPCARVPAGYGTLDYRPADTSRPDVQGVIHDLSDAEMRSLALTETGYDVRDVLVDTGDGVTVLARAFFSNWSVRLFRETLPTKLYIGKICSGAADFGLTDEYQVCALRQLVKGSICGSNL